MKVNKENVCYVGALACLVLMVSAVVVDGRDVLGLGHSVAPIITVLILIAVFLAWLLVCSLLRLVDKRIERRFRGTPT